MKMYTPYGDIYDDERDPSNRYYENGHDHAMIPFLTGEAPIVHPDLMREFRSTDSTAASKQLIFNTDPELDPEEWRHRNRNDWSKGDVLHWIASVASDKNFSYEAVNAPAFNIDGRRLLKLSRSDFLARDPNFGGILYDSLNRTFPSEEYMIKKEEELEDISGSGVLSSGYTTLTSRSSPTIEMSYNLQEKQEEAFPFDFDQQQTSSDNNKDSMSETSDSEEKPPPKPVKRPPGRPPGAKSKNKAVKKTGRLWEFIRDLLLDPQYCPSVIRWEDHDDGVFRFVKSDKVAEIWGTRKNNDKMNYEKLSRAMRYYYKSKVLQPVLGRKLVYKFGPTARGWQSDNPNFGH